MKKTLTINLSNIVFHIDEDAYISLHEYLQAVEKQLSEDEKKEVMQDVEARIAELFSERIHRSKNVVNKEDVDTIIEILGKPNQYATENESAASETNADNEKKKKRSRRFYRDPENSVLGGVCGGLSAYLKVDVVLLRIIFVLLAFFGIGVGMGMGLIIPIYLLMWLIAPAATTVSQRLEMQGEDVTIDNIKEELNNAKSYVESDEFKNSAKSIGNRFGDFFRVFFKVIFGIIAAGLAVAGVLLILALLFGLLSLPFLPGLFAGLDMDINFFGDAFPVFAGENLVTILSFLIAIILPVVMLIYFLINVLSKKKTRSKPAFWIIFAVWIVSLFVFYIVGSKVVYISSQNIFNWVNDSYIDNSPVKEELRTVDDFQGIKISDMVDVKFIQDSVKSVMVSAPENFLNRVITEVNDGVLKIYTSSILSNHPLKVYVSNPQLEKLAVSGLSSVETQNQLQGEELQVDISGASKVNLNVDMAGQVAVKASGNSKAKLSGQVDELKLTSEGFSKIDAEELLTRKAIVQASGISKIYVYATDSLDMESSGNSEIKFKKSATTIIQRVSGISKIEEE